MFQLERTLIKQEKHAAVETSVAKDPLALMMLNVSDEMVAKNI